MGGPDDLLATLDAPSDRAAAACAPAGVTLLGLHSSGRRRVRGFAGPRRDSAAARVKLRLDQNLPHDLTADLVERGHDVHTVPDEQLAGHTDPVVVRAAAEEGRMVLTLDRGVGDLRHYPPGSHAGIVVLRPPAKIPPWSSSWSTDPSRPARSMTCASAPSSSNPIASASGVPNNQNPVIPSELEWPADYARQTG